LSRKCQLVCAVTKDFDRKAREELRKYAKVVRRVLVARPAEPSRIFSRPNLGSLPVNYKA
jgi:hypothetical protein